MVQWDTKKEHVGGFYPLCVEYLTSGDPLLLHAMSEYQLSDLYSFDAMYIMKFTHDIGVLCDSLNQQLLLTRLQVLMKNPQAANFFKTKLLQHPSIPQKHSDAIEQNLLKSDSRRRFWLMFLCEFRESMRYRQAEMFHVVKHALAVRHIGQEPQHISDLKTITQLGVGSEVLAEFWALVFRTTPFWLGTRDYKFYDLVEKAPGGFDQLLSCKMDWGQFCNRYTADILAPTATSRAMQIHVKMVTEGVLRGALSLKSVNGRFERFLASDKTAKHPIVKQTVDDNFMRLSSLGVDKFPALLELLTHYRFYRDLLPHFEGCEQFLPSLKLAAPEVAAKIISVSTLKDQLLHSYPESRENVLVLDLGL